VVELFRKNIFVVSFLMLGYITLIRIHTLLDPVAYHIGNQDGHVTKIIYEWLSSSRAQAVVAILLIYIQALLINRIGIKHKLNKDFGLLPGIFYALVLSIIPDRSALTPSIIANTFIIISVHYIITTYNKKEVSANVFSSGMYAALASIIYFPYLYFFIITTVGFLIMRSFSFKERLQHLCGWIIPYVLIWVFQFWMDQEDRIIPDYFKDKYGFFNFEGSGSIKDLLVFAITIMLVLTILLQYVKFSSKRDIRSQKKIDLFYWVLFYGGISTLFYAYLDVTHFAVIALPFGYFLAMSMVSINNLILRELIHILLLSVVVYIHFY
jgi:hypothetical protein